MRGIKFQDIHYYLSSDQRLKNFIKRCDSALLAELQDKINIAVTEWEQGIDKELEALRIREKKLQGLIGSEGSSPQKLITAVPVRSNAHRKMKYQYSTAGEIKKWSGVGRVPLAVQEQLNAGAELSDFLIDSGAEVNDQN
ncbi:H-NS family nucleoid-associated regulatory protein [Rahnella laticis]|uniref:H-NS family nucleoid-associated regulatory protein n=1 Tax=Rahnella laticis TaxID=2787622 RepID=UPI0018A27817|nr:DNA-binding protein [Rahnella laticis]MBF7997494.1 DNA-binding protein [Rahnella laticis]